jgi:polyhydroxyalkanoate synthase
MAEQSSDTPNANDPFSSFANEMGKLANGYQQSMAQWMNAWGAASADKPKGGNEPADEASEVPHFDTAKIIENQMQLMNDYQALWVSTTQRLMNRERSHEAPAEPVVKPEPGDNRFRDAAWSEDPVFDFIKQSYLLNSRWIKNVLSDVDGLDENAARKLDFYGRTIVDALSPTNFPMTNPVVLRETAETHGENLRKGFAHLMEDLKDGSNGLRPRQTDMSAFEVGKNVAISEGAVVFENPFFQLLQYAPTTQKVHKKPLLIIPPWINKFYILDLKPENSFIRWAVGQGYTVFVMSWVNPDERYSEFSFVDYMKDGIFAALDAVEKASGERHVTAIGYCIGGTLLAMALAYMAAKGDDRITAATFFAAQVDFEDAGDLKVFTDGGMVHSIESQIKSKGYLDGASMAATFNLLRPNDLIWSFVVNNYLLGKEPPVFDLLYWNSDSTRFPAKLWFDYIRCLYNENQLVKPGGMVIDGVPIDLSKIKIPVYIQASKEDHIAPSKSVYKAMRLFGGPKRFVMAGSGHIAGVINPPDKKKYQHWTNPMQTSYGDVDAWFAHAEEHPGSWWPDWNEWLAKLSGEDVAARAIGSGELKAIEPAPGSYVKVKG